MIRHIITTPFLNTFKLISLNFKGAITMINKERKIMRPSDLKAGESKVVVYYYNGYTIIVPDPSWDMKGDLSKLPQGLQDVLAEPVRLKR